MIHSNSRWQQTLLMLMAASALALSGCAKIDMPTTMTSEKIQLVTENYSQRYDVVGLTATQFDAMAARYDRYGSGQAEVIVSYDPYSKKNTAMKATDQLHRISNELSRRGVTNLKSSILAVDHSGDQSDMMIGYASMTAEVPENCDMMPGYHNGQAEADFDYKLGCSVQTMVSRQVAHPADLAGRAVDTDVDGRRTGAIVEPYRAGSPNSALSGAYTTQ